MPKSNATRGSATVLDDPPGEFYRPPAIPETDSPVRPPRSPDPDSQAGEPFLRARRRVPVRRGILPPWARTRWGKIAFIALSLAILGAAAAALLSLRHFLTHDPRFRIQSATSVQTLGNSELTRSDLLSVFGADIGRNLFLVPLAQRRAALQQIPWVESATVMRLWPNQLRVAVRERTPIAFVEFGGRIELADIHGVILNMTPQDMAAKHYSFPVVTGIRPSDPLPARSARMHLFQHFLTDLDSGGKKISAQLSEINVSDPEDVRATVPSHGSDLLLDFGQEDFLARWQNYQTHIDQWWQQYPRLASIDLRYEHEVVLKMTGDPEPPAKMPAAAQTPAAPHTALRRHPRHPARARHHAHASRHSSRRRA